MWFKKKIILWIIENTLWIPDCFSDKLSILTQTSEEMGRRISRNRHQAPTEQQIDILKNRFNDLYEN